MRCKGIGYFQNLRNFLRNCLEIFLDFWGIFLKFLWKFFGNFSEGFFVEEFFWQNFLGKNFWKDFLGGYFLRGFFGREEELRSLEVRLQVHRT